MPGLGRVGTLSEPAGLLGPHLHVGPVPSGSAADLPARFGQQLPLQPTVDGAALDAEALGDLLDANRLGGHAVTVQKVLTPSKRCANNLYMTSYPRNDSYNAHYGTCDLHNLPCCSVCCKHENECAYGDCNKPMTATILCFRANGSVAEKRDACRKHATYGPLGVGYDMREAGA